MCCSGSDCLNNCKYEKPLDSFKERNKKSQIIFQKDNSGFLKKKKNGKGWGLGVKSRDLGPSKTAQWVRMLAAKPHSLSLNLGTHVMGCEN